MPPNVVSDAVLSPELALGTPGWAGKRPGVTSRSATSSPLQINRTLLDKFDRKKRCVESLGDL
jgi:hypothetical protein